MSELHDPRPRGFVQLRWNLGETLTGSFGISNPTDIAIFRALVEVVHRKSWQARTDPALDAVLVSGDDLRAATCFKEDAVSGALKRLAAATHGVLPLIVRARSRYGSKISVPAWDMFVDRAQSSRTGLDPALDGARTGSDPDLDETTTGPNPDLDEPRDGSNPDLEALRNGFDLVLEAGTLNARGDTHPINTGVNTHPSPSAGDPGPGDRPAAAQPAWGGMGDLTRLADQLRAEAAQSGNDPRWWTPDRIQHAIDEALAAVPGRTTQAAVLALGCAARHPGTLGPSRINAKGAPGDWWTVQQRSDQAAAAAQAREDAAQESARRLARQAESERLAGLRRAAFEELDRLAVRADLEALAREQLEDEQCPPMVPLLNARVLRIAVRHGYLEQGYAELDSDADAELLSGPTGSVDPATPGAGDQPGAESESAATPVFTLRAI